MSGRRRAGELSVEQARRIALAAQGFTDRRPTGRIDRRHLRRVLDRIGLLQIDSVNVVVRSQELPLFARLGPHPRSLIDDATAAGELFEYWLHEASHVPIELFPALRWKMRSPHKWKAFERFADERPGFVEEIYARVVDEGPLVASDLKQRVGKKGPWWDYDDGKIALEALFYAGRVTAWRRPRDFARVYDVTERRLPSEVLALPPLPERTARKLLLDRAARHHGVATLTDLADYYRLMPRDSHALVAELVEAGRLIETTVDGWAKPAYLHVDAVRVRKVQARALLSPFDPVVWHRERGERLFDFRYRIEIYTPAHKRVYGYYVLPFLLGDRIVARVDLKADRPAGRLLALGVFGEACVGREVAVDDVVDALAGELTSMARWLGLEHGVDVGERGDLVEPLRSALRG